MKQDDERNRLLSETLRQAQETSPYYRRVFGGRYFAGSSLDVLPSLPILTRDILHENEISLHAEGVLPSYINTTAGTTFDLRKLKRSLINYKTEDEVAVLQHLLEFDEPNIEGEKPIVLRLIDLEHGFTLPAGPQGWYYLPLEQRHHFSAILSLLGRTFRVNGFQPQVGLLGGQLFLLKLLTLLCQQHGVDQSQFAIKTVFSTGNHLTSRWHKLLADFWGAEIIDCYGLSEVPGLSASRCQSCARFHLPRLAIVEFLGIETDRPVTRGFARLVATSLYPLAEYRPMIRYDTGDIVEVHPACARSDGLTFDYVGRVQRTAVIEHEGESVVPLGPLQINEVLDRYPDVNTTDHAVGTKLAPNVKLGFARYHLEVLASQTPCQYVLHIELRWPPDCYPDSVPDLRHRLTVDLLGIAPRMRHLVDAGAIRLELKFHPPSHGIPEANY